MVVRDNRAEAQERRKAMMVDCVMGRGTPSCRARCQEFVEQGLAKFTGNQHNESWTFIREELTELTIEQLAMLYEELVTRSENDNDDK